MLAGGLVVSASPVGGGVAREAPSAQAPNRPTPAKNDARLLREIADAVNRYPRFTIFDDISASADGGVVTLFGKVTTPLKKQEIERIAGDVRGVKEVHNKIEVLPVSIFDDELRYTIARTIYGHPSFWSYAAMSNPPIHIIVEHGHVTLTGVVASEVDRALARSLASGSGALSVTNNLRTDAEMRMIKRGSDEGSESPRANLRSQGRPSPRRDPATIRNAGRRG